MKKLKLVVVAILLMSSAAFAQDKTIVEVAASNPSLSTFVTAVKATGLDATLNAKGPFTVLAPNNDAFAALPKGQLEMLMKPENKQKLTEILTLHVLPAKVMSTDLKNGQMAKTVSGKDVKVNKTDVVMINGAKVVKPDIKASNGVIHVVDKIIVETPMKK